MGFLKNVWNGVKGFYKNLYGGKWLKSAWNDFTGITQARDANATNIQLQQDANEFNYKLWKEQTDYNSPENQMFLRSKAGLNPYGLDGGGEASSPPSMGAAQVQPEPSGVSRAINLAIPVIQMLQGIRLKEAQIVNMKRNTDIQESLAGVLNNLRTNQATRLGQDIQLFDDTYTDRVKAIMYDSLGKGFNARLAELQRNFMEKYGDRRWMLENELLNQKRVTSDAQSKLFDAQRFLTNQRRSQENEAWPTRFARMQEELDHMRLMWPMLEENLEKRNSLLGDQTYQNWINTLFGALGKVLPHR